MYTITEYKTKITKTNSRNFNIPVLTNQLKIKVNFEQLKYKKKSQNQYQI